jgi:type IV secretory pathway protease TraF
MSNTTRTQNVIVTGLLAVLGAGLAGYGATQGELILLATGGAAVGAALGLYTVLDSSREGQDASS